MCIYFLIQPLLLQGRKHLDFISLSLSRVFPRLMTSYWPQPLNLFWKTSTIWSQSTPPTNPCLFFKTTPHSLLSENAKFIHPNDLWKKWPPKWQLSSILFCLSLTWPSIRELQNNCLWEPPCLSRLCKFLLYQVLCQHPASQPSYLSLCYLPITSYLNLM